ncbi:MAG: Gldg family protein [Halioglobus sp.]|nr:Gldg family protein [Halioglobus sp.]
MLRPLRGDLQKVLKSLEEKAGDKLKVSFVDPEAGDGAVATRLEEEFGLSPQRLLSLLDPQPFWFYMMLEGNGQTVQVPLPETLDKAALSRAVEAAVKRLAPGFMKTVAVVKPSAATGRGGSSWRQLEQTLRENVRLIDEDITDGTVASAADLLLAPGPRLDRKQRFAIDQFLMQGGSVVATTSPFDVQVTGSLGASKHTSGLEEWLAHQGVDIASTMVLDPRAAPRCRFR